MFRENITVYFLAYVINSNMEYRFVVLHLLPSDSIVLNGNKIQTHVCVLNTETVGVFINRALYVTREKRTGNTHRCITLRDSIFRLADVYLPPSYSSS